MKKQFFLLICQSGELVWYLGLCLSGGRFSLGQQAIRCQLLMFSRVASEQRGGGFMGRDPIYQRVHTESLSVGIVKMLLYFRDTEHSIVIIVLTCLICDKYGPTVELV